MNTSQSSLNTFLETALNDSQKEAVLLTKGPILVIAGAGSGKTRVITARIAHLILNHHIDPTSIIAVTFTNKAAHEMKERVTHFLGAGSPLPFIGTFHAYCLRLLKQYNNLLEHPFIAILDTDDQQKMINGIIQRHGLQKQINARTVAYHISHIKNHAIDPTHDAYSSINRLTHEIFMEYETEKRTNRCLDFDDLLLQGLALFKKNESFKKLFQEKVRHILVDEYQDTNTVQHALLKQMTHYQEHYMLDSVCVVGDEDQSIYSWRGATVSNIRNFSHDFANTITITIKQNYRSVQPILDVANKLITHNSNRNAKNLWSERAGNNRVHIIRCASEYQEAEAITHLIKIMQKHKKSLNSIALLYRVHTQSRALEEALIKQSIPYRIIGGIQFYERKEIKDLFAYLRLIANPFDKVSFFRIINCPTRGLGAKFEELFYERWAQQPFLTFHDIAQVCVQEECFGKAQLASLQQFIQLFSQYTAQSTPSTTLADIIKTIKYIEYIKDSDDHQEAQARLDNIQELMNALVHFEKNGITTIKEFLDEVTLMQDALKKDTHHQEAILLMTLHAAKGLEFDTVIIAGLEEGLLPASRSTNDAEALEEERRLFYVGITRAREHLLITQAKYRYTYGTMTDQNPSRFLREIPTSLAPVTECLMWRPQQFESFFIQWLNPTPSIHKAIERPKHNSLPKTASSNWKINQPVMHAQYGPGIVQKIEYKEQGTFLTIQFKNSTKKISAHYLQSI